MCTDTLHTHNVTRPRPKKQWFDPYELKNLYNFANANYYDDSYPMNSKAAIITFKNVTKFYSDAISIFLCSSFLSQV